MNREKNKLETQQSKRVINRSFSNCLTSFNYSFICEIDKTVLLCIITSNSYNISAEFYAVVVLISGSFSWSGGLKAATLRFYWIEVE